MIQPRPATASEYGEHANGLVRGGMASAAISSGALGSSGRHASMDGDSTSGSRTSDGPSDTGSSEEEAAAELARQAMRKGWVPNLSDVVGGPLLRQPMHGNAMH